MNRQTATPVNNTSGTSRGYPSSPEYGEYTAALRERPQTSSPTGSYIRSSHPHSGPSQARSPVRRAGDPYHQYGPPQIGALSEQLANTSIRASGNPPASNAYSQAAYTAQLGSSPRRHDWQPTQGGHSEPANQTAVAGPSAQRPRNEIHGEIQSTPGDFEELDPRKRFRCPLVMPSKLTVFQVTRSGQTNGSNVIE